jgi:2-polyprenyl-6-hydroxyphenyl methylase/3-demethylubiquinone-9 3-methyltransferase
LPADYVGNILRQSFGRKRPFERVSLMPGVTGAIDPREAAQFAALADRWWDAEGPFRPLHRLGPTRMRFVVDAVERHFGRACGVNQLEGLTAIDIGCGGGLATEPLARLGAKASGLDVTDENIAAARAHAEASDLTIDYQRGTAEALAATGATYDIVLSLEVVEHVPDPDAFLAATADLVAPGGLLILATINRTIKSLALAKFATEYVLRWLPHGTHDWRKFLKPSEMARPIRAAGLTVDKVEGAVYQPLTDDWRLGPDTAMNYMLSATRR